MAAPLTERDATTSTLVGRAGMVEYVASLGGLLLPEDAISSSGIPGRWRYDRKMIYPTERWIWQRSVPAPFSCAEAACSMKRPLSAQIDGSAH